MAIPNPQPCATLRSGEADVHHMLGKNSGWGGEGAFRAALAGNGSLRRERITASKGWPHDSRHTTQELSPASASRIKLWNTKIRVAQRASSAPGELRLQRRPIRGHCGQALPITCMQTLALVPTLTAVLAIVIDYHGQLPR